MRDLLEMRQQSDARRLVISRLQVQIVTKTRGEHPHYLPTALK